MSSKFFELGYKSDSAISGKLLTVASTIKAPTNQPILRPWFGGYPQMILRPEYEQFRCKTCGRVDELRCLQHGIPESFDLPDGASDIHTTDEYFDLWSRRLMDCIEKHCPGQVVYFPVPSTDLYFVPWPKKLILLPEDTPLSSEDGTKDRTIAFHMYAPRCNSCGRTNSSTFDTRQYLPPDDAEIGAIANDTDDYPRMFRLLTWFVSSALAK